MRAPQPQAAAPPLPLPPGYGGYVGDARSSLARGHAKLYKHDPWHLTAEELLALLRALTDDVLAVRSELNQDLIKREEKMQELIKAKRIADSNFRKVRLAFEGPKKKPKGSSVGGGKDGEEKELDDPTAAASNDGAGPAPNGEGGTGGGGGGGKSKQSKVWKQTATQKQFDTALKAQQKASDAYERGLRKCVGRTEPVGYDRNLNRIYFFHNDPDLIHVEYIRSPTGVADHLPVDLQMRKTSWHVLDNKTMFDQYVDALDVRGKREHTLHQTLSGQGDAFSHPLKRGLYDDVKKQRDAARRKKERQELEKKRADAFLACKRDEEGGGRRSGRFQSQYEIELSQIDAEIAAMDKKILADENPSLEPPNYYELTGLELLESFDNAPKRSRRTREKRDSGSNSASAAAAAALAGADQEYRPPQPPVKPCSKLWPTGNIDGSGAVGAFVEDLLSVEELCQVLCPWQQHHPQLRSEPAIGRGGGGPGGKRKRWIAGLEALVNAWNTASPPLLGPAVVAARGGDEGDAESIPQTSSSSKGGGRSSLQPDSKRRRLDHSGASSSSSSSSNQPTTTSQVVAALKQPLLELEERVYNLTGLAMADRDGQLADDNMSTSSDNEEQKQEAAKARERESWKRIIHKLSKTPAKKYSLIRRLVEEAMKAARKAHLPDVVSKLRSALLLHHPNAAKDCKVAANAVLLEYGGYAKASAAAVASTNDDENEVGGANAEDDESDYLRDEKADEDKDGDAANGAGAGAAEEEEEIESILANQAMLITGSLNGGDYANRIDWMRGVKEAKTMSRLSSLAVAFATNATAHLSKMKKENETLLKAIEVWQKEQDRLSRARSCGSSSRAPRSRRTPIMEPTEIWASVDYTDEFCMVKLESFPYWPARKCVAKDEELQEQLTNLGRVLVSILGEDGSLRVVKQDKIKAFTGKVDDEAATTGDDSGPIAAGGSTATTTATSKTNNPTATQDGVVVSKDTILQLEECMAIARRILRGRKPSPTMKQNDEDDDNAIPPVDFVEEKKTAS